MRHVLVLILFWLASPAGADETVAASVAESEPATLRTGFFFVSLTPLQLLGERGAASLVEIFAADEMLVWQLYVPPSYDAQKPAGAVVYVSRDQGGGPPRSWTDGLGEKNLVWIGARNAGGDLPESRRMFLAMLAPLALQRDYAIDAERIYVAGYSVGAKTAARVAVLRPKLFKGGVFMNGALHWGRDTPALFDDVARLHYVFLTGSYDPGLKEIQRVHKKFKDSGVEHVKLLVDANRSDKLPEEFYFMRAIDFLDSRIAGRPARNEVDE